jgi:hypothetical protein
MIKPKWNLEKALKLKEKGYNYKDIGKILNVKPITLNCFFLRHYGKLKIRPNSNDNIKPTDIQNELLFGSLLGDGSFSVTKNGKIRGKIEHCLKQKDYLVYKHKLLNNLVGGIIESNRFDKRTNKVYSSAYFHFKTNEGLKDLYNMFYNNGIKIIPQDLSLLTPFAIAIWFMDDGARSTKGGSTFSTNCFSYEDIERIKEYLTTNYNLNLSIHKNKAGQFLLYVKKKNKEHFINLINDFIIDSMKYKL